MAQAKKILPDIMASPETGERLIHGVRPFEVAYKSASVTRANCSRSAATLSTSTSGAWRGRAARLCG